MQEKKRKGRESTFVTEKKSKPYGNKRKKKKRVLLFRKEGKKTGRKRRYSECVPKKGECPET